MGKKMAIFSNYDEPGVTKIILVTLLMKIRKMKIRC